MASFDYLKSQNTAEALLKRFGTEMELKRTTVVGQKHEWDPDSGTKVQKSYKVIGITKTYDQRLIDGVTIHSGDKNVIISAKGLSVVPDTNDVVCVDGIDFSIVAINPVSPAGVPIIYNIQARV